MKTGILIIARLGSTRLPQKHLVSVKNRTFIEWLVKRYLYQFESNIKANEVKIIIATSVLEENKLFEEIFKDTSVEVFYGSDSNIPLRQLQCASKFSLDQIISIDGDDVLCSTEVAKKIFSILNNGESAVKSEGLPLGMNVIGYKVDYLEKCLDKELKNSTIETGWGRIFDDNLKSINVGDFTFSDKLRFTLDYQVDADFFANIINYFDEIIIKLSDSDLIEYVVNNNIFEINSSVHDIYWDNFNNFKQKEIE